MTGARWVRVRATRSMVPDGVRRGNAPAVTWGNTRSDGAYPLLCKQGVVGSTPFSSTALTRTFGLVGARGPRAKRALRVGCALGGLA